MLDERVRDVLTRLRDGTVHAGVASVDSGAVLSAIAASSLDTHLVVVAPTATIRNRIDAWIRYLLSAGTVPYTFPRWPKGVDSVYEPVVESPFMSASRMGVLGAFALADIPFATTVDSAMAASSVMPFDAFADGLLLLEVGREVDREELVEILVADGYRRTSSVAEVGEFAVRGGIVDIYSPFDEDPVRIDLDGDEIVSMRVFDPATQRGRRSVARTWVVPTWEMPLTPASFRSALIRLGDACSALGVPSTEVAQFEVLVAEGRTPAGFLALRPKLFESMARPLDYLSESALVVVIDPDGCRAAADGQMESLRADIEGIEGRLVSTPDELAISGDQLLKSLESRPRTLFLDVGAESPLLGPPHPIERGATLVQATATDFPVERRVEFFKKIALELSETGQRLLVLAPSEFETARVRSILEAEGFRPVLAVRDGLSEIVNMPGARRDFDVRVGLGRARAVLGFESLGLLILPSELVFGVKDVIARRGEKRGIQKIQEIRELAPGDHVIHRDHGMGVFIGLKETSVHGNIKEFLEIHYKGGDRLLVPVEKSNRLEKYMAPDQGPARELDKLGGQVWARKTSGARKAAREIAGKLKVIYARRMAQSTEPISPPDAAFREFEATFSFETTQDQERAIEDVLEDLARDRPMDRLVCGDVGFGKTEVAIRAAYKAALDGKQVAVLVPTTLLAEQHRLTFSARLGKTPVVVESLSRLRSNKESQRVLQRLADGTVDIVIGTHRLLSKDVKFKHLGLLVVDEEHRFGVVHKERLREISATVHTLTLSATPIPRTLHMALAGIRELSIIATPPRDRLAVRTFVARSSRELIRSTILREIQRGGQVFFVRNRVEGIYDFAGFVQSVVPEARVTVAHGQMSAPDLEGVMSSFMRGDKDVLIATTIIESGLDIGSANTMLIADAESLGLAQLYQLRGRVGRAVSQAYCYLLVADPSTLTEDARKRIEAIERFSELSSGFSLASMDLEIRGAGDMLGADQSGHMAAIGYDLFMELLSDAVAELNGETVAPRLDTEIKVDIEARIPTFYVADEVLRLRMYKRLAGSDSVADVDAVTSEMKDRFGPLPPSTLALVALVRLQVRARGVGLATIVIKASRVTLVAGQDRSAIINDLVGAVQRSGLRVIGAVGHDRFDVEIPARDDFERLVVIDALVAGVD